MKLSYSLLHIGILWFRALRVMQNCIQCLDVLVHEAFGGITSSENRFHLVDRDIEESGIALLMNVYSAIELCPARVYRFATLIR